MALRASYYGLKKKILDKVLGDYDAVGVMTNKELTEDKVDKGFIQLTSSDDLNNLKENGKRYYWDNATPINYAGDKYCKMFVFTANDFCHQVIIRSNNQIFMRQFNGTAWQSWYKFEGVIVS